MKRNEYCEGCSWNFGSPIFPCQFCDDNDLYIDFPIFMTEDKKIERAVLGVISVTIFLLLGYALDIDITEILPNAEIQKEDN